MPWKETTTMEERAKLIRKWQSGLYSRSELAQEFGVSRPTVYEWTYRFDREGEAGLIDRPPIPNSYPHRTSAEVVEQVIAAKRKYPLWGPAKLIDLLRIEQPDVEWPAASTAGRILDERGLVVKRRARRAGVVRYVRQVEVEDSGVMMTADHKGQIRMLNGQYCYPVTVCDPVSRFTYAIDGKNSTSGDEAKATFERIFRKYGVPEYILTDNGSPFSCSRSLGALSRLAVWWIKVGIQPLTIHKGCPWENGIHERMHRTLKAATARPPAASMQPQQKRFDLFREEYNTIRPHEGIGGRRPADLLKPCRRPYSRRLLPVEYPAHYETRAVHSKGEIKWRGDPLFIGQSLIGEQVALVETDEGIWTIYFSTIELGRYDERTKKIV